MDVVLSRHSQTQWTVDLSFSSPQSFMVFPRSANNYRENSWTPVDEDTQLKNINGFDAIWFEQPQSHAKFIIKPKHPASIRTLTPAMIFGDHSIMFSSDEFLLFPADNYESVASLWGNTSSLRGQGYQHFLKVESSEAIVVDNQLHDSSSVLEFGPSKELKVYIGKDSRIKGKKYSGIMDSSIPEWFSAKFDSELSQILERLQTLWGVDLEHELIAYIAYDQSDTYRFSFHGMAVDEQTITLQIRGDALSRKSDETLRRLQWVVAHEAVHIYQRRENFGTKSVKHSWIVEGAADAMTSQLLLELEFISHDYVEKRLKENYMACVDTLNGTSAFGQTASQGKFYDCGELIALITDRALPDHTIFEFWNVFLSKTKGRQYDSKLYFKTMRKLGADKDLIKLLKTLVEDKIEGTNFQTYSKDYSPLLRQALTKAGVNIADDAGAGPHIVSRD